MAEKVVLINPGNIDNKWASIHPPIHLAVMAAYLQQNDIEVHIVDQLVGHDIVESLERLQPTLVGITATTPMAPDAYKAAKIARDMGITTIMGGKHAMAMPDEAAQHVDIVVLGEGEVTLLEIAQGRRDPVIKSGVMKSIDDLPGPAWELLDMDFYHEIRDHKHDHMKLFPPNSRIGALLTMRGCPYSCVFCYNSWHNTPVRFNSAERVFEEIKHLVDNYKITALFFMDDDLMVNRKRIRKICELLIQSDINIVWGCQASVNSLDEEVLALAKKSGCIHIGMGFESGSPRMLEYLKKGRATVEKNTKAAALCKKMGINSYATFMVGSPTETVEDAMMTRDFIRNTPLDGIGVLITTPFPGTEIWQWCKEHDLIPDKIDWSIFNAGQVSIPACDTISPEEIVRLRDELDLSFYPIKIMNILKSPTVLGHLLSHPIKTLSKIKHLSIFKKIF